MFNEVTNLWIAVSLQGFRGGHFDTQTEYKYGFIVVLIIAIYVIVHLHGIIYGVICGLIDRVKHKYYKPLIEERKQKLKEAWQLKVKQNVIEVLKKP